MVKYSIAPELKNIGRRLIVENHRHLIDAVTHYMFRGGSWVVRGKTRFGLSIVVPPLWRAITNLDLVVVVNEEAYRDQSGKKQIAILDNLLCYFSPPGDGPDGAGSYTRREPDVQEFSEIVCRHGVCLSNVAGIIPGRFEKIDYTPGAKEAVVEINGEDDDADDAEPEEFAAVNDYDALDDSGCTVTTLVDFEK